MLINRPNRARSPGRTGAIRPLVRAGLLSLSLLALSLEGCASLRGGCGSCGTGSGVLTSLRTRIGNCNIGQKLFHRRGAAVAVDACDPTLGAIPIESGEATGLPGGPLLQAPPVGSDAGDPNLQPLPSNSGTLNPPAGGTSGANNTGVNKSLYQTRVDKPRGEPSTARREAASPVYDPLADLPSLSAPLDAPETTPPAPPTAGDRPEPATIKPAAATASAGMGPGIRRFKVIEPRLAIGTLPGENGWKWLSELGYKTVIDLREPSEIGSNDLAAVNHAGLRLIAIPMSLNAIDSAALAHLERELANESNRPIFVFDGDGARAATFGFLHLALHRQINASVAEREVEELSAADTPTWKAGQAFLKKAIAVAPLETKPKTESSQAPPDGDLPSSALPVNTSA